MTISIYDPRSMAAALKQMPPARSFLKQLFFGGPVKTHTTESFDVDIQTEGRRAAEFSNPKGPGKAVDRTGFTTHNFRPPQLSPKMSATVEDMQTRLPGEHIYAGQNPDSRAAELLGGDLALIDSMIVRREEIMIRDGLVNSEIVCTGDDVESTITFPARDGTLTLGLLDANDRWSAETSDPIRDFRKWRRAIDALTGLTADVAVLGSTAIDLLLANTSVQNLLDNRRMDLGQISPGLMNGGATYYGRLGGMDIWGYDELDADGNPLIAVKTVLVGCTDARCEMHYGPVAVKTGEGSSARIQLVPAERVPQSWVDNEPPVRWVKVGSRPLPVAIQNNAFLTATVSA